MGIHEGVIFKQFCFIICFVLVLGVEGLYSSNNVQVDSSYQLEDGDFNFEILKNSLGNYQTFYKDNISSKLDLSPKTEDKVKLNSLNNAESSPNSQNSLSKFKENNYMDESVETEFSEEYEHENLLPKASKLSQSFGPTFAPLNNLNTDSNKLVKNDYVEEDSCYVPSEDNNNDFDSSVGINVGEEVSEDLSRKLSTFNKVNNIEFYAPNDTNDLNMDIQNYDSDKNAVGYLVDNFKESHKSEKDEYSVNAKYNLLKPRSMNFDLYTKPTDNSVQSVQVKKIIPLDKPANKTIRIVKQIPAEKVTIIKKPITKVVKLDNKDKEQIKQKVVKVIKEKPKVLAKLIEKKPRKQTYLKVVKDKPIRKQNREILVKKVVKKPIVVYKAPKKVHLYRVADNQSRIQVTKPLSRYKVKSKLVSVPSSIERVSSKPIHVIHNIDVDKPQNPIQTQYNLRRMNAVPIKQINYLPHYNPNSGVRFVQHPISQNLVVPLVNHTSHIPMTKIDSKLIKTNAHLAAAVGGINNPLKNDIILASGITGLTRMNQTLDSNSNLSSKFDNYKDLNKNEDKWYKSTPFIVIVSFIIVIFFVILGAVFLF